MEFALVIATEEELSSVCRGWKKLSMFDPPRWGERMNPFTGKAQKILLYREKPTEFPDDVAWYARILQKLPIFELAWLYRSGVHPTHVFSVLMPVLIPASARESEVLEAEVLLGPRWMSLQTEFVYQVPEALLDALASMDDATRERAARACKEHGYEDPEGVLPKLRELARSTRAAGRSVYVVRDTAGDTSPPADADPRDPDWGFEPPAELKDR